MIITLNHYSGYSLLLNTPVFREELNGKWSRCFDDHFLNNFPMMAPDIKVGIKPKKNIQNNGLV